MVAIEDALADCRGRLHQLQHQGDLMQSVLLTLSSLDAVTADSSYNEVNSPSEHCIV